MNRGPKRSCWLLCAAAMLLAAVAAADDAKTPVTVVKAPATCGYRVFDPKNPPANMPATMPDETGLCFSDYQMTAAVSGTVIVNDRKDGAIFAVVRIDSVRMSISLASVIWLTEDATEKIRAHEAGHLQISETFYADADAVARDIGQEMIGEKVFGQGQTIDDASRNALEMASAQVNGQYMIRIRDRAAVVQDIYDRITWHGTNAVKESDAIRRAMEEAKKKEDETS